MMWWLFGSIVFAGLSLAAEFQEYRARPAAVVYCGLAVVCLGAWLMGEFYGE